MRDVIRFILIPYLLLVAVRLLLAWPLDVVVTPDELKFLGQARYLATGSDQVDPKMNPIYRVGYPALLVPAFLLGDSPVSAFKRVQIINALLMSLIYPLAFYLAGRLRATSRVDRMLIAICVSLYPAAMLYSTTAMSANAFMPGFFVYVATVVAALARPLWWRWLACFAAGGGLVMIHERAAAIVVVTLITLAGHILLMRRRRASEGMCMRSYLVWGLAVLIVGLAGWIISPSFRSIAQLWGNIDTLLSGLQRVDSIWVTFCGQLWYLGLATCGVLFAGLLCGFSSKTGQWRVPPLFWLALLGSAASIFALSVVFLAPSWERFGFRVYGRYNEGVLLPVLIVALLGLKSVEKRRIRCVASVAGALALVGVLAFVMVRFWIPSMDGPPHTFNASAISIHSELFGWGMLRASASAGVGLLILGLLFSYRWRWGIVGLGAFFSLSTLATYQDTWVQRHDRIARQQELIQRIQAITPKPETIFWDPRRRFGFSYLNAGYFLPEFTHESLPGKVRRPSGELVLSGRLDFSQLYPGARLVGLENLPNERYIQGLWVLPGPLQDTLATRRWLMPECYPCRLGDDVLGVEMRLVEPSSPPRQIQQGEEFSLNFNIDHRGSAPWPHRGGLVTSAWQPQSDWTREYSVGLLVRWFATAGASPAGGEPPAVGKTLIAQAWVNFPRTLYPGESIRQLVPLRAKRGVAPLSPGDYRVTIAIAQVVEQTLLGVEQGALEFDIKVTR